MACGFSWGLVLLQETQVQSLGWEDPLEKGTGYPFQCSCLKIPQTEESGISPWDLNELDIIKQISLSLLKV